MLTTLEKRAIANLVSNEGYRILLEKVVKLNRTTRQAELRNAHTMDAVIEAAFRMKDLEEIIFLLESFPQQMIEELKQEGDIVYG